MSSSCEGEERNDVQRRLDKLSVPSVLAPRRRYPRFPETWDKGDPEGLRWLVGGVKSLGEWSSMGMG